MKCPPSDNYLPKTVAVDFDRTADTLGPFGPNTSTGLISKGMCHSDNSYFSDDDMNKIAHCALDAFDTNNVQATFFWAAHTELEPKWDYIKAWDKGWLQRDQEVKTFLQ